MKKKIISAILMIALAFTLACPTVFAANRSVEIRGTVYGSNGTTLSNVPIKIVDNLAPNNVIAGTYSSWNGAIYLSTALTEGNNYTVTATYNGIDYNMPFGVDIYTNSIYFNPVFSNNNGYPNGTYPPNISLPGLGNIINGSYDVYGNYNFSYYDAAGGIRYGYVDKTGKIFYDSNYNQYLNVTFETNGGTEIGKKTFARGEIIVVPTAPVKSGYVFGGWYIDSALTTMLAPDTRIEYDTTLYARWLVETATPAPVEPKPPVTTPDPDTETDVPQTGDSSTAMIPAILAVVLAGGFLFSRRREDNN